MNLNRILAIGGLATIVAVSNVGCDTPGGNYANEAAYNDWAGQLANEGDYQKENAAANVGTFFGNMGNAAASKEAAESGKTQIIIINSHSNTAKKVYENPIDKIIRERPPPNEDYIDRLIRERDR